MIGAIVAMNAEAEVLLGQTEIFRSLTVSGKEVYVGRAFGKDVTVIVCGVGKVNAALGAQLAVSKFDAEKLFNFGVAGGLDKTTLLGGVYQIEKAVQFDFDLTQLNGTKIGTLDEYKENYLGLNLFKAPFEKRKLGTADRFNDSEEDFRLLTGQLKANIRDMEGGAIVQAAHAAQLPVYSVKAISDVAGNGSTTEQYLKNREKALENLKAAMPVLFEEL